MITVTGPQYTATPIAAYRFTLSCAERIAIPSPLTEATLTHALAKEHQAWCIEWMTAFLGSTAKHFSKPYTAQQLYRITQHRICPDPTETDQPYIYMVCPQAVTFRGGKCEVEWGFTATPMVIDIPDLDTVMEATQEVMGPVEALEEVDVDTLATNATEMDHVRMQDRQKLKEARLKAKIALYRVQHQMARYQDRYGASLSEDSDDSSEEEDD